MRDDEGERPPRFITPAGFAAICAEYEQLFGTERPKLVETISWAAGNGDRSENGDYIYGRKRLREIDRRLTYLSTVMKQARIVDPAAQMERDVVHFGARVKVVPSDTEDVAAMRTFTLVGQDEAESTASRISWISPIGRALLGARVDDQRIVTLPAGTREYDVLAIDYPDVKTG